MLITVSIASINAHYLILINVLIKHELYYKYSE